jgi:ATP-dependent helicase IRC3
VSYDEEQRALARQGALFGGRGLTALESARLAAGEARTNSVTLRPYQSAAIEAFVAARARGRRRTIVNLPTGTGKTVFGFALARRLGERVCWLAHRDELLRQPLETASRVWPEASRGLVKAQSDERSRHVVVASVQTLARSDRLERLLATVPERPFGLLVVDECHHVTSDQYRRVLEGLGAFREDGPPTLGLTATLERADGVGLGTVFEEIVFQLGLNEAIDRGYLAPFRGVQVELPLRPEVRELVEAMLGKRARRPGPHGVEDLAQDEDDIDMKKAERALLAAGVAEATARAVLEHASDRKTIVFTCTIRQAQLTTAELVKLGIRAEHVSGEMPAREREAVLARLKAGETRVVCNAQVLTEGFDEPSIDCIAMAKPTRSRSVYAQSVGRGLRLYPGKRDCLVLDMVFASVLGLQTAATLGHTEPTTLFTGGGGGSRERNPETSEKEEEKRVLATAAASLGEGVAMDGRRERVEGPKWLTVTPTCWALSLWPNGVLVVDRVPLDDNPTGELFEAFVMPARTGASDRVSDPGPFEWVFGVAEDFVRSGANHVLVGSPRWRKAPVSQGQLAELARRGLPMARTAGDAADLLTVSTVRARLGY